MPRGAKKHLASRVYLYGIIPSTGQYVICNFRCTRQANSIWVSVGVDVGGGFCPDNRDMERRGMKQKTINNTPPGWGVAAPLNWRQFWIRTSFLENSCLCSVGRFPSWINTSLGRFDLICPEGMFLLAKRFYWLVSKLYFIFNKRQPVQSNRRRYRISVSIYMHFFRSLVISSEYDSESHKYSIDNPKVSKHYTPEANPNDCANFIDWFQN